MKKRKCLALTLAVAALCGSLSGCGAKDVKTTTEESDRGISEAEEAETTSEESEKENQEDDGYYTDEDGNRYKKFDDVRLKMLVCWNGGFDTALDQYNNDVANTIRDRIGVTVEFEGIMMSEEEKLNLMFASGEMPDMVAAPYWGGSEGATTVIKKAGREGRLIDVAGLIPQYPNLADVYDIGVVSSKFLENDIDMPENNGARYVVPNGVASGVEDKVNWAYGVFVRADVADTLGVDPASIKTSEELYDFMIQARDYGFKDVNGNDCIVATTFHNGWSYDDFAQSFQSKKLTPYSKQEDGTITLDILSDNWVEKNLFLWKLVHENILDKECFTTSDDRANEKVGNGTALFTCAQYGCSINATQLTGLYDARPDMRYIPVGPLNYKDGSACRQIEPEGVTGCGVIIFPSSCQNIEAALTWMDYLNSPEGIKLSAYGFEGDTYELNEDGQPRMTQEWIEKHNEDPNAAAEELRARGIGYMQSKAAATNKNYSRFGENSIFEADAENEYVKEYKQLRPVEMIPGYLIDSLATEFGHEEFRQALFDTGKETEYKERAFFADSEEEARKILEEYQNYLRDLDGGRVDEFLEYMTEASTSRDDIVF